LSKTPIDTKKNQAQTSTSSAPWITGFEVSHMVTELNNRPKHSNQELIKAP